MLINREKVCDALEELSDYETQKRLWVSDGSNGAEVSSFTEAVEGLFTDSGLSSALERNGSGLGNDVDSLLLMLDYELKQIDIDQEVEEVIADPQMSVVRSLAKRIHDLLAT